MSGRRLLKMKSSEDDINGAEWVQSGGYAMH